MNQNSYQTRRLLATRAIRHDGQNVETDGEVFATETDAKYLIRIGAARDPAATRQPTAGAVPVAAAPSRRGPGRPPKAESATRAPVPSILTTSDAGARSGAEPGIDGDADAPNPGAGTGDAPSADGVGESGDRAAG